VRLVYDNPFYTALADAVLPRDGGVSPDSIKHHYGTDLHATTLAETEFGHRGAPFSWQKIRSLSWV
jgi:hypothetical protein